MGRARRAQKIAAAAAYGGGISAAGVATAWGVLVGEAKWARRIVGTPTAQVPDDSEQYGAGPGEPLQLVVLGDSSARGLGVDAPHQTVGAIVATAVAALSGRPVQLRNVSVSGAISSDLADQLESLAGGTDPQLAIIMVGANDVTKRTPRAAAVRSLTEVVDRLREQGAEVVVGTCPDLGVVRPMAQPLRLLAQRWSRDLAAAQTVAVVEHGGRTVSLGDLLGPEFRATPTVMFSADRFHPSPAGYARVAAALLPSVLDALGEHTNARPVSSSRLGTDREPAVSPVSVAAKRAVAHPGTEVNAAEVDGTGHGARGRWATLLRRFPEQHSARNETARADASASDASASDTSGAGTSQEGTSHDGTSQDGTSPLETGQPPAANADDRAGTAPLDEMTGAGAVSVLPTGR